MSTINTLRNPDICAHCRIRKIKCDGKSPCLPCRRSRAGLVCVYDLRDNQPGSESDLSPGDPSKSATRSSSKSTPTARGGACAPCRYRKKKCDAAHPHCGRCVKTRATEHCFYAPDPSTWRDEAAGGGVIAKLRATKKPEPPNVHVFRNLGPAVPDPVPSTSAVSDVALDDMNMSFRFEFLAHRLQFGLHLTFARQQAIILGDLSNTFIHPFFIHLANMWGCHLYQERERSSAYAYIKAVHVQLMFEAFLDLNMTTTTAAKDASELALANYLLAISCLYVRLVASGRRYLRRALAILRRANIRFVPHSRSTDSTSETQIVSSMTDFSEVVHEQAAFLAQLVYVEIELELESGERSEQASAELEKQFVDELPGAYPILFQICPTVLRVHSVILVKRVEHLKTQNRRKGLEKDSSEIDSPRELLQSITSHVEHLNSQLEQFHKMEDRDSCVSLLYSIIICSTALAEVCNMVERTSDTVATLQDHQATALQNILEATAELTQEDFRFLDPLAGLCWSTTISLLQRGSASGFLSEEKLDVNIRMLSRCITTLNSARLVAGSFHPCGMMESVTYRRKPGAPNFLSAPVRLAYGL